MQCKCYYLCNFSRRCEIFLAHCIMLRRTQIVYLLFEWLCVEILNFYISQHINCSECSVFLSPEHVIVEDLCAGVAEQGKINPLIISIKISNQCCQHSYFPQWSSNHCLRYTKTSFTTITCVPVVTACSWSKYWNKTGKLFYYSAVATDS